MTEFTNEKAVYWIVALKIHPGAEAAFHAAREKLVASTKEEAGALNYEWSVTEDGLCHIYERTPMPRWRSCTWRAAASWWRRWSSRPSA